MNNKTGFAIAAIAIVAALLITTSAMNPSNAFAGGHYKRTTQNLYQQNSCGNGPLPFRVDCQNSASQIQGKNNAAAVAATQGSGFSGHNDNHMPDHGHDDGKDHGHDDEQHHGQNDEHDGNGPMGGGNGPMGGAGLSVN
ncbi:MAG TPA: hypothetical protein VH796_06810 [Nitrososphaeraceae archaeon]|jgi:hypothetical protein